MSTPFVIRTGGASPAAATPSRSGRIITESKTLLSALLASLALHAAAVTAVGVSWPARSKGMDPEGPIRISLVSAPTKTVRQKAKSPVIEKDGSELLADPEAGEVFNDYFATVKARIHEAILKKYADRPPAEGKVALFFVLDSKGRLRESWAAEKLSTADLLGRHFALTCLKDAAPFAPFPPTLHFDRISFNVSLEFS